MAVLHVRNVPESLYKRAQAIAAKRGKTLSTLVVELLEQLDRDEAARRKHARVMSEIRRNLASRPHTPNVPGVAEMIRQMREEREAELMEPMHGDIGR